MDTGSVPAYLVLVACESHAKNVRNVRGTAIQYQVLVFALSYVLLVDN